MMMREMGQEDGTGKVLSVGLPACLPVSLIHATSYKFVLATQGPGFITYHEVG